MKKRAIVSLILFISFLLLPVSAMLIDHSSPTVAFIARSIHGRLGMIFTVAAVFHIVYNWKLLKSYLFPRKKQK
jgi:hypothetical protein